MKTFGTSKPTPVAPSRAATVIVLGPKDLPAKGIRYSMNHVRRLIDAGKFPRAIHFSKRRIGWYEHVIDEWIAQKAAESEAV